MKSKRAIDLSLIICTAALLTVSLVLSFTVSDYYIFNRILFISVRESRFEFFFVLSQWIKKAGLLLIPMAVFYKKKSCSDLAKYILPVFVIISCCTWMIGDFFGVTLLTENSTAEEAILAKLNEFIPKWANMTLFFISNALYLAVCGLLFVRDGFKANKKSFIFLPVAIFAVMPLNIFENFFDIRNFVDVSNTWVTVENPLEKPHFLWFRNFTIWHFIAILALAGFTVGAYYFLKNKDKKLQNEYLVAGAITLLIQYHSKDSMLLGDGYNVYKTVYAAIPLFICNMGVYVSALSVILKKRPLYATSFFVHAVGALTVFVYFGKDSMSNYGIIFSYSILYFCVTHCLLFALCVLPSALGHYKFRFKDCIIPLVYYFLVIVIASLASGGVATALENLGLPEKYLKPNYAFTQVNPLPIDVPIIPLVIGRCTLNLLYLILLYIAYVCLFFAFTGAYYAFLGIRVKVLAAIAAKKSAPETAIPSLHAELEETAVADESGERAESVNEEQTESETHA